MIWEGGNCLHFFASCSKSAALHTQLLVNQVLWFETLPPSPTLPWLPLPQFACPTAGLAEGTPRTPPKPQPCPPPAAREGGHLETSELQQLPLCSLWGECRHVQPLLC